jgi:hypothetical protein
MLNITGKEQQMEGNFKRKLIAAVAAPLFGLAVGAASAQTSASGSTTGTGATGGMNPGTGATTPGMGSGRTGTPSGTTGSTPMGSPHAGAGPNDALFDRLDANRDGKLTREEVEADASMRGAWGTLDPSNSGSLSRDQFNRFRITRGGADMGASPGMGGASGSSGAGGTAGQGSSGMSGSGGTSGGSTGGATGGGAGK